MDWSEFREEAELYLSRNVRYGIISGTTETGHGDQGEGDGDASDPVLNQKLFRRMFPYGMDSRPPVGAEYVSVQAGGGAGRGIMVGARVDGQVPTGLDVGELVLYCIAAGCVVKLDKNGAITITGAAGQGVAIDAGTGADVVVNGGTFPVARATADTAGPYPIVGGALFFKA